MSANTAPIYPGSLLCKSVHLATANTARDGTGTLTELVAAPTNGARIDRVLVKPQGQTHQGVVRFWLVAGSDKRLLHELPLVPNNPAVTAVTPEVEWKRNDGEPLALLDDATALAVSSHTADPLDITAFGGLY